MRIFLSFFLLLVVGCGTMQRTKSTTENEHSNFAGTNAEKVSAVVQGLQPQPVSVTITGTNNTATITTPPQSTNYTATVAVDTTAAESAKLDTSESYFSKTKLPLSIALVCGAVGLLILVYAFNCARRSSAAFNAGFTAVDNAIALHLQHTATSPDTANVLNAIKAELHKNGP